MTQRIVSCDAAAKIVQAAVAHASAQGWRIKVAVADAAGNLAAFLRMPGAFVQSIDIPRGAANFKVFADVVKNVPTEFFELATPDGKTAVNYGYRTPVGVVGVICPWNLPLLLMTWKVGPALACGNTVVVKPSEETPRTAALLGEVMNKVGIPKGVYNVVHGFGPNSAGEFLTTHPGVDALTFTGETRTGEVIMKAAANGSRPVSLEMGGKNAALVFADCDFEAANEGTLRSAFASCGQVCLGTERVYVERPIFDKFVAAMKQGAEAMKIGVPEDPETGMGPLISKEHQNKVLSYYQIAAGEGATVVTGGGVPPMAGALAEGCWVQPAIWTRDISRAHRVAQRMEVGIAWVNSWFLRDLRTPFGGAKQSGIGREGGVNSIEFYTELKNDSIKL